MVAIKGVAEVLDWLQLPVCVASSGAPEQIRGKLELTGLLEHFSENLFSATMVARGKPAPDLFLYAAQRLAAVPDRCLVIEDSPAGIDGRNDRYRLFAEEAIACWDMGIVCESMARR